MAIMPSATAMMINCKLTSRRIYYIINFMKKQYLWLEFSVVFIFLILPPLFVNSGVSAVISYNFSPLLFAQIAIAVLLDIQHHKEFLSTTSNTGRKKYFVYLSYGATTLGLLMVVFAILQGCAIIFPKIAADALLSDTNIPSGIKQWIICIVTLAISAYYEESLYRQFLPNYVSFLVLSDKSKKWLKWALECVCILIFAFSHRYLGWIAVVNAAVCGSILRFCCVKTGSIYTSAIAHFTYNVLMYVFLAL